MMWILRIAKAKDPKFVLRLDGMLGKTARDCEEMDAWSLIADSEIPYQVSEFFWQATKGRKRKLFHLLDRSLTAIHVK